MTQHHGFRRVGLVCDECHGRSFSDPTKAYHYPDCSQYARWRWGPQLSGKSIVPIITDGICPHGFYPWTDCQGCTDAADYDGGE